MLPLTAPVGPPPAPVEPLPPLPAGDPSPNPWQVKAAARAEGGNVTLEILVVPSLVAPKTEEPSPQATAKPNDGRPVAPLPPTPEAFWEDTPEQAAEQMPPPLPLPETVRTLRVTSFRRFFGDVPVWQWAFWLGVMAIAVGGGVVFGHWVVRRLPDFQTDPAITEPIERPAAVLPNLLTLNRAQPTTTWQMGQGRLEHFETSVPYATAHLVILTGRTNVAVAAQQLLSKRWFGSGRFEPEKTRTQRLPMTLCGQTLDRAREEGLYRFDLQVVPASRDRLILARGDRQQAVVLVAYGRNPPRLADELLKSLACR